MTHIEKTIDDQIEAMYWLEDVANLTQDEVLVIFGDDHCEFTVYYANGRYHTTCGIEKNEPVGYMTGGWDYLGPHTRVVNEWEFAPINHYPFKTPDYMAPLSSLFASFNDIFGGRK
jgi:hypothetical protein